MRAAAPVCELHGIMGVCASLSGRPERAFIMDNAASSSAPAPEVSGGQPLDRAFRAPLPVPAFLEVAVRIAEAGPWEPVEDLLKDVHTLVTP